MFFPTDLEDDLLFPVKVFQGLPWWLSGKEPTCIAGNAGDEGSIPGSEGSVEEARQPTPVFLPGESHGQKSLVGCGP